MISQRQPLFSPIAEDVWRGLTRTPKSLPPWLFYDKAGSSLFEEITDLPEYYLTRTERRIFKQHADEMAVAGGADLTLIELGAGTATKTCTMISAILRRQKTLTFYPVDVSPNALDAAVHHLTRKHVALTVKPLVADYTAGLPELENVRGRKMVLYIGSSIGNFEPLEASAVLARIRRSLSAGDVLLVGTDMAKDATVLVPAYDDAQGVTARFNLNLLTRINRELGGHFDVDSFRHVALWNHDCSRMEMHLESLLQQTVAIDDLELEVRFNTGERIHTENSYKFTMQMVCSILGNAGFTLDRTWMDDRNWFGLHLATVRS
jgi:L-histidine N-alpha-methyltransferase